jgi:hypothetical protein
MIHKSDASTPLIFVKNIYIFSILQIDLFQDNYMEKLTHPILTAFTGFCLLFCFCAIPAGLAADTSFSAVIPPSPGVSNTDSDGDGLPDWWEARYFPSANPGPADDPDRDGLNNKKEYQSGTNPLESDSDEDGLSDYQEIFRYFTDPLLEDTDRGGNSDGYETAVGTSPLNPDDDASAEVFSVSLREGWNLVCLPRSPLNTDISSVLAPIAGKYEVVWTYQQGNWKSYDPVTPPFSDFFSMETGAGYWIKMSEPASLIISGTSPPKSVRLSKKWNLVGYNSGTPQDIETAFSSVSGKISAVWTFINGQWQLFDPVTPPFSNLFSISPACGYWVYAEEDCTWTLP